VPKRLRGWINGDPPSGEDGFMTGPDAFRHDQDLPFMVHLPRITKRFLSFRDKTPPPESYMTGMYGGVYTLLSQACPVG
jgi:hypothetical protein